MSQISTDMYICECGRVFDSFETYERGTMPIYGKEQKPLRGKYGLYMFDEDGNKLYAKCHICNAKEYRAPLKYKTAKSYIGEYLKDNEYITTDSWELFGFKSRQSCTTILSKWVESGWLHKVGEFHKRQKYFLKKT